MRRKTKLSPEAGKALDLKKKLSGLREEEVVEQALKEVSVEGLVFIKRIKERFED